MNTEHTNIILVRFYSLLSNDILELVRLLIQRHYREKKIKLKLMREIHKMSGSTLSTVKRLV